MQFKFLLFFLLASTVVTFAQVEFVRHLSNGSFISNSFFGRSSLAVDMDSDGDQDIITHLEAENRLVWFENIDGAGTFSRVQNLISDEGAYNFFADDLDGDGDADIMFRSKADFKFVWLENNDLNWTKRIIIDANQMSGIANIKTKDLDFDGDLDIIVSANSGAKIRIFTNTDGLGNFSYINNTIAVPGSFDTIDMDLDNDLDIVVANESTNEIGWYENNGSNELSGFIPISAAISRPFGISVNDMDGDNEQDIVIVSRSNQNNKFFWFKNSGNVGVFENPQSIGEYSGLAIIFKVGDLDNNGSMDLCYASETNNSIAWFRNSGSGNFSEELFIGNNLKEPTNIQFSDLNRDGRLDIIGTSDIEGRIVWFNLNESFFNNIYPIYSDVFGSSLVHTSDLDNDGDTDIISSNIEAGTMFWKENLDGEGDDIAFRSIDDVEGVTSIYSADLNGNGLEDIIYTSLTENYVRYRQGPAFNGVRTIDSDLKGAADVKAADLDMDGDIDIAAVGYYDNQITWYENNGNGEFQSHHELTNNFFGGSSIFISDLNNDDLPDIVASSPISQSIIWFKNTTNGFESAKTITTSVPDITSIFVKDLDSDGLKDIIFGSLDIISVGWIKNINGETFADIIKVTNKQYVRSVSASDIDGDLDNDIISASLRYETINWHENIDGLGNFSNFNSIGITKQNTSIVSTDMDNDLDVDIVSGTLVSNNTVWYENSGPTKNTIFGSIKLNDDNSDCTNESPNAPYIFVNASSGGTKFSTFTDQNGNYQLSVFDGEYTTEVLHDFNDLFNVDPQQLTTNFNGFDQSEEVNFCISPAQSINDLIVQIYPLAEAAPGFETEYLVQYENIGSTTLDGFVQFKFNGDKLEYLGASEVPSQISSGLLTFNFTELLPFYKRSITISLKLKTPPTNEIGDELIFESTVNPIDTDNNPEDNIFNLSHLVVGSFDPNDILVLEGEQVHIEDSDNYLHYLIRFQNTGTARARNVKVTNILADNLDWDSIRLLSTSHPSQVQIVDGNRATFYFEDIDLPDVNTDETGSNGYILYKIKPSQSIDVGDTISNNADIYFDFNQPILTNTVVTTFFDTLGIEDNFIPNFRLFPVPSKDLIFIKYTGVITEYKIYDTTGQLCKELKDSDGIEVLNIKELSQGIYFIKLKDQNQGEIITQIIKN